MDLTDSISTILPMPAGQNPFADLMRQMQDMQNQQQGGGQYRDSTIIDGEAREVQPDQKKIEFKDVN
jgi:UPF0716 protein FxsA